MTDRMQAPTNAADAAETTTSDEQSEPSAPEESTATPEQGETETPAAQRRARLRKEIRAGMQRALKH